MISRGCYEETAPVEFQLYYVSAPTRATLLLSYPQGPQMPLNILVYIPCASPTLSPLEAPVAPLCDAAGPLRRLGYLICNISADNTVRGGIVQLCLSQLQ